ncbi:hypothetical protein [Spiroplasma endosymbiont of Cantharis rufa]|uniref:hypothetical protein n=1 Tax=Spiroplasma endosymbiont of Cantharis rufa TaxID=3066279 RepID=UPI0030CF99FB
MNISYIDFDWNKVIAYDDNFNEIFRESCLILRDLRNYEVLFIGDEAIKNLKKDGNFIAINFTENSKIVSEENFILFISYFKNKYKLIDFPIIIDRYKKSNFFETNNLKFIELSQFYSSRGNEFGFIDLRNSDLNIYNKELNEIFKYNLGKIKILNLLNRYFYLNFNSTLNTKKTKDLLKKICKGEKVTSVSCRNFSTGQDNDILIVNIKDLTKELEKQLSAILKDVFNFQSYSMNLDAKEVLNYVN